jgi:hypothetical protein
MYFSVCKLKVCPLNSIVLRQKKLYFSPYLGYVKFGKRVTSRRCYVGFYSLTTHVKIDFKV